MTRLASLTINNRKIKNVNWHILTLYGGIVGGLIFLFIMQSLQPLKASDLKNAGETATTSASEAVVIASYSNRISKAYYQAQLQDIEKNLESLQKQIEQKKYEKSVKHKRQLLLQMLKNLKDELHTLSLSYQDNTLSNKEKLKILEIRSKVDAFIQSL